MSVNTSTLPGVTVLSNILGSGVEFPPAYNLVDEKQDIALIFYYAIPFAAIVMGSIAFTTYTTDDDGFVYGKRCIESLQPRLRILMTVLTYVLEGMHVVAVSFGKQGSDALNGGSLFQEIAHGWLWYGDLPSNFAGCAVVQIFLSLFFIIPFILWLTLKRDSYVRFAEVFVTGKTGVFTGLMKDAFLLFLPLPMMIQFLRHVLLCSKFPG
jgi:hypothetical protein